LPRGLPAIRFVVDDSALTPFEYRRREISVFIPHGQEVREWNTSPGCVVYISVDTQAPVRILAIAGDLRPASSKSALVGAVERLARDTRMEVSIYRDIDTLPPFDPDLDGHYAPATVASFRAALQACDAVLISSPESAHGVHGVMKNALDWVADSGDLVDKPIALINASGRARHAWGSLSETSAVMSAHVILEAWITVPLDGRDSGTNGTGGHADLSTALTSAIEALALAARDAQAF
jgi:chromate reductase